MEKSVLIDTYSHTSLLILPSNVMIRVNWYLVFTCLKLCKHCSLLNQIVSYFCYNLLFFLNLLLSHFFLFFIFLLFLVPYALPYEITKLIKYHISLLSMTNPSRCGGFCVFPGYTAPGGPHPPIPLSLFHPLVPLLSRSKNTEAQRD